MSTAAVIPSEVPMEAADEPLRLVVDGQHFEVRQRPGVPGQYDFDWISGPHPGYGFMSAPSDGSPSDTADLVRATRSFLKLIDPETGYIE